jgi:phage tail protein X
MKYPDASQAWDPRARPQRSAIDTRSTAQISGLGLAAAQTGKLPPPANAAAAAGNSPLNVPQAAMVVGEPISVIWGRRRGNVGGVLVFPRATEARFENTSTTVTSRYHMVIGDGRIPDIQRRDVRLGECRIGTFSQNYNQRAGTFVPGNFATAQTGYSWTPTNFTGGGGNYQGLSTFEAGATFTGGSDDWKTGWNIFLRGGTIVERGRLLDSTVDSSDNIADLVLWALQRSGRVPDALIDLASLTAAARFCEANGLWCNGEFNASGNLGDWLIRILPDFLLRETKVGGKFGLRPLLPTNTDGTINTSAITPEWLLTEAAIVPDSYQVEYAEASSRRPVPMAMLWRQQHDDSDVPIVRTLTVGDPNAAGPPEQHDLSQFATSENHPAKVGAYLYARRTLSTHTATVRLKAGNQTGAIVEGNIVQVYLQVITSREPASVINRYYVVESIGHSLAGEETLSLSHFPVNSSGQSLIALAVAAAVGTGTILSSNRTGGSCDLAGASTSTTVPSKSTSGTPIASQGSGGSYWATGGQFLDPLGDAGAPSDSPPDPAGGDIANNGGAIPPSDGTNSAGGDSRCPNGYSRVTGEIVWYQIIGGGPTDYSQRTQGFAARGFPLITNYTTSRFGNWEVEEYTIIWTDADTGLAAGGAYTAGNLKYLPGGGPAYGLEIAASSYSCSLDDGSAGPTVSNATGVPKLYQTRDGDTMETISERFYGTTARADDIQNANPWLMGLDNWGLSGQWLLTLPN